MTLIEAALNPDEWMLVVEDHEIHAIRRELLN